MLVLLVLVLLVLVLLVLALLVLVLLVLVLVLIGPGQFKNRAISIVNGKTHMFEAFLSKEIMSESAHHVEKPPAFF